MSRSAGDTTDGVPHSSSFRFAPYDHGVAIQTSNEYQATTTLRRPEIGCVEHAAGDAIPHCLEAVGESPEKVVAG